MVYPLHQVFLVLKAVTSVLVAAEDLVFVDVPFGYSTLIAYFFKWANHGLFLIYFVFSNTHYKFYNK